jgi:hypothetical protein
MKKNFFLFLLFILIFKTNFLVSQEDHVNMVHKYLAHQGWELVRYQYPYVANSEAQFRMQNPVTGEYSLASSLSGYFDYDGIGGKGKITSGAYGEDELDIVYRYTYPLFGYDILKTSTHFWNADGSNADSWKFDDVPGVIGGSYENAYEKILAYWNGYVSQSNNTSL